MLKLSVIIVNYNVKYFLEQALRSVRKASTGLPIEVIVVDNNSADDSVKMTQEKFPEVKLIENQNNVGFSKANNQAIRISQGEYVLLLNPDTVVEEDTFEKCIEFMDQHPRAGALGVKMIDGSGQFLPESKRGFPSPFVAFCKMFGLSRLFPRSKTFNHYHLGYLPTDQTSKIEVLSGAFMFLRKSVLNEIGLLDENFFMYGEDIDLSYRVLLAGYDNYYFAETRIIHYKGESTKKGSLNYIKVFYNAMIIFAQKHFEGQKASSYIFLLRLAIYLHATLTLISNWAKKLYLPIFDSIAIYSGLVLLKNGWAIYHFNDRDYYPETIYYNILLYTAIWISSFVLLGIYAEKGNLRRLIGGIFLGSLIIAAVYGFLEMPYRSSRALILLGTVWTVVITCIIRLLDHYVLYKNFDFGRNHQFSTLIVGSIDESERVESLLLKARVQKKIIGLVAPSSVTPTGKYINTTDKLPEIVRIYNVEEIIFCSKDISAQSIMSWMTKLGPKVQYKILPEESLSIIGSNSKNATGELYTIEISFQIDHPLYRRQKRMLDILFSLCSLFIAPLLILFTKNNRNLFHNALNVLFGRFTWVGYSGTNSSIKLPPIKPGILKTEQELKIKEAAEELVESLDFAYAKNYSPRIDIGIIFRNLDQWSNQA